MKKNLEEKGAPKKINIASRAKIAFESTILEIHSSRDRFCRIGWGTKIT